eukprot:m51a1_g6248 hypothetical protein (1504) ;mRNA; f:49769-63053
MDTSRALALDIERMLSVLQEAVLRHLPPSDLAHYSSMSLSYFGRFLSEKLMAAVAGGVSSLVSATDDADTYDLVRQKTVDLLAGLVDILDASPLQFLSSLVKAVLDRVEQDESPGHAVASELAAHVVTTVGGSIEDTGILVAAYNELCAGQERRSCLRGALSSVFGTIVRKRRDMHCALFQTVSRRLVNYRIVTQLRARSSPVSCAFATHDPPTPQSVIGLLQSATTRLWPSPGLDVAAVKTSVEQIASILGPECNVDVVVQKILLPQLFSVFGSLDIDPHDLESAFMTRVYDAICNGIIPDMTGELPKLDELRGGVLSALFGSSFSPEGGGVNTVEFLSEPLARIRHSLSSKGAFLSLATFALERTKKQLQEFEGELVDVGMGKRFVPFTELVREECCGVMDDISRALEGTVGSQVLARIPMDGAPIGKRLAVVGLLRSLLSSLAFLVDTDNVVLDGLVAAVLARGGAVPLFSPRDLAADLLGVVLGNYDHFNATEFVSKAALSLVSSFVPAAVLELADEGRADLMPEALSRSARQAFANSDVCVDLCRALCGVYEAASLLPEAAGVVDAAVESVKRRALAAYVAQSSAFILDGLSEQQRHRATPQFFHTAFVRSLGQSLDRCAKAAQAHVAAQQTLISRVLDACVANAVADDPPACLELQRMACEVYPPDTVVAETLRLQLAAVVQEATLLSGDGPCGAAATPRFLSADAQTFWKDLASWLSGLCFASLKGTRSADVAVLCAAWMSRATGEQAQSPEEAEGVAAVASGLCSLVPLECLRGCAPADAAGKQSQPKAPPAWRRRGAGQAPDAADFDKLCLALVGDALGAAIAATSGSTPAIVRLVREVWDYAVPALRAGLCGDLRGLLAPETAPMWTRSTVAEVGEALARTARAELSAALSGLVALAGTAGASKEFTSTGLQRLVDLLSAQSFTVLGSVLAEAQRPLLESVAFWAPMVVQSFAAELRRPRYVRMPADAGRRAGWLRRLREVVTSYGALDFEAKANLLFGHFDVAGAVAAFAEQLLAVSLTPHRVTTRALCLPFTSALASDAGALARAQRALLQSAGPLWDRLRDAAVGDGGPLWPALSLWSGCLRAATLQWDNGVGLECDLVAQFEKLPAFVAPRAQTAAVRALVVGLLELKERMEAARPHCLTRILVWFLAEVEHLRDAEDDSSATLAELAGQLLRRVDALAADPLWVASSGFSVQAELFRCLADAYAGPLLRAAFVDAAELLWRSLEKHCSERGCGAQGASEEDVDAWCSRSGDLDRYRARALTFVSSVVLRALKRAVGTDFLSASLARSFAELDALAALVLAAGRPDARELCCCAGRLAASVADAEGQHSAVAEFSRSVALLVGPLADYYMADPAALDAAVQAARGLLEKCLGGREQQLSSCKLGTRASRLLRDLMAALLLAPLESAFNTGRTSARGLMLFLKSAAPLLESLAECMHRPVAALIAYTAARRGLFRWVAEHETERFYHGLLFEQDRAIARTLLSPTALAGS